MRHYYGNPRHTQSMIACYDFDGVFLENPVMTCIVGMLLTCPIDCAKVGIFSVSNAMPDEVIYQVPR